MEGFITEKSRALLAVAVAVLFINCKTASGNVEAIYCQAPTFDDVAGFIGTLAGFNVSCLAAASQSTYREMAIVGNNPEGGRFEFLSAECVQGTWSNAMSGPDSPGGYSGDTMYQCSGCTIAGGTPESSCIRELVYF